MTHRFSCKARNPRNPGGPLIEIEIPSDLSLRYYKFDPLKYENLRAAREVLENSKRIFSGVRLLTEGYWCYVGKPTKWYITEDQVVEFPSNKVYVVFVNDTMKLYEHRAEQADSEDLLSPKGWKDRFGGLVWKSIS